MNAASPDGGRVVLILGASSAIGACIAQALARTPYHLVLAGRDIEHMQRLAADIDVRFGTRPAVVQFDANDTAGHASFADSITQSYERLDGVVIVFGDSDDADRTTVDPAHAEHILRVNFTGAVTVLTPFANYLETRRRGFIVGVTSVAGDRGRQSNYVYGSAKGGLALFLQGLRNRLHASGVRVITVKPGFIDTRMIFGIVQSPLTVGPERVGRAVARAVRRGAGRSVVYVPWFWRWIMLVIRMIPEWLFKRMRL